MKDESVANKYSRLKIGHKNFEIFLDYFFRKIDFTRIEWL